MIDFIELTVSYYEFYIIGVSMKKSCWFSIIILKLILFLRIILLRQMTTSNQNSRSVFPIIVIVMTMVFSIGIYYVMKSRKKVLY